MNRRPNSDAHIRELRKKYGARAWILRHLHQVGIPTNKLVQIYCSLVRPVLEYPAVAFHSGLTGESSDKLERLQSASLRTIFGHKKLYAKCLEKSGLTTLKDRREALLSSFTRKAAASERFSTAWFPINPPPTYPLRRQRKFEQDHATRDRLIHSPIFRMRQILNEDT